MYKQDIKKLMGENPVKKPGFWKRWQMRFTLRKIEKELSNNPELDKQIDETLNLDKDEKI